MSSQPSLGYTQQRPAGGPDLLHPQLTLHSDNSGAGKHVTNDLFAVEKINQDAEVPTDAVVQLLSATDAPLGDVNISCLDMQVRGRTFRQNYSQEARGKY